MPQAMFSKIFLHAPTKQLKMKLGPQILNLDCQGGPFEPIVINGVTFLAPRNAQKINRFHMSSNHYKWSGNPYTWPYKWVTRFITTINRVMGLTTGFWAHLV